LLDDHALRERLIARGHARAAGFSPVAVRAEFVRQLNAAAA
jgi:hypothetical protein